MRITAYVLRFVENCRAKAKSSRTGGSILSIAETQQAVDFWAKVAQAEHYRNEVQSRRKGNPLPQKSVIASLNLWLNANGVLCLAGRLTQADMPFGQIIVPPRSRLGWLLIDKAHRDTLHGGAQAMMAYIRTNFWIPTLRSELKKYIGRCRRCLRMREKTATQLMGSLPADRVRPARPFCKAGVDYAGPFEIRMRPGRPATRTSQQATNTTFQKGYVAVFVCMLTRAVHLEPVMGMTSEAFIAAFRFVARRGHCAHMYSDNGTTFVGANTEMQDAIAAWQHRHTLDFVQSKDTEWHFITPSALFQGGIWEAAVKSMKYHLRRVIGKQKFSYEVLATLLAEIEACLNSRPICAMSDDKDDARALTPAHFIIGEELVLPIPVPRSSSPRGMLELWKARDHMVQDFWAQWPSDCIHAMQTRPKWRINKSKNFVP